MMQEQQRTQHPSRCRPHEVGGWLDEAGRCEHDGGCDGGSHAAPAALSRTMRRRRPTTTTAAAAIPATATTTLPRPNSGRRRSSSTKPIAATLVASATANRQRRRAASRQSPYSARDFIQQMMLAATTAAATTTTALTRQADHQRQPGMEVAQVSGLNSSSLARELLQQISRPAQSRLPKQAAAVDEMELLRAKSKIHLWHWSDSDTTQERLLSDDKLEVCFHPECAESTAAIRGSQPFRQNGNYYYWEVTIYDKIFGTSMMLGLCTEDQALQRADYCNLIGLDANGWSLSHKGLIWHDGKVARYTNDFGASQDTTIGLLFDTMRGELSYLINGENLGVAFSGLNNCNKDLYPVVGSTAKRTRMRLTGSYCGYVSLLERTSYTILRSIKNEAELVQTLQDNKVPKSLIDHMAKLAEVCRSQTEKPAKDAQCVDL